MCDKGFERQTDYMDHYKTGHSGEKFECSYCGKVFKPPFQIKFAKHMRKHEEEEKRVTKVNCVQCGYRGNEKRPDQLESHLKTWGPFHDSKCVQCAKEFTTYEEHCQHVKQAHNDDWWYCCGFCPEKFNTKSKL